MTTASKQREPPLIIPPLIPSPNSPATLIFIHGYNDRAASFKSSPPTKKSLAHYIHANPALRHVKVIVPEALPCYHPSIPGYTWYNISKPLPDPGNTAVFAATLDTMDAEEWGSNEDDMAVSMDYFEKLIIDEVAAGTPINRIVLMGYSSGGGLVTLFLLTRKLASKLGAVISHAGFSSTCMKSVHRMQKENGLLAPWSGGTRFFMLHGEDDVFVPRGLFDVWRGKLEEFKERGIGMAEMNVRLVESTRHAITVNIWCHVMDILRGIVPVEGARSSEKL